MTPDILQEPNTVLRAVAKDVPSSDIGSARFKKIIGSMQQALHSQKDGVAIAAPQIGVSLRIFIVAGRIFSKGRGKKTGTNELADRVFINPVFTRLSKKKAWMDGEGCLSVRWKYGSTQRHEKVTVRALDEHGAPFEMAASGLLAQICQHEMDHLNGILFIDHARNVTEFLPEDTLPPQ